MRAVISRVIRRRVASTRRSSRSWARCSASSLSDNILTLFVFWELTGFTSFLLIGFEHERADARAAALQALIVTGAGGLALLAAGVLLVDVSGTTNLSAMVRMARPRSWRIPFYAAIAALGAARRLHEVRAGAVPFLAAERDGSADAGQRVSALRDDGQGRACISSRG